MVSRYFRRALLIELALDIVLAAALYGALDWSAWAAASLVPALLAGVRFLLVATSLAAGQAWRSPRARDETLSISAVASLALREWAALLRMSLWDVPFERAAMPPEVPPRPSSRPVLVLLHGYLANRGYFHRVARRLSDAGLGPVHAPNLPVMDAGIDEYVAALGRWLDEAARCGAREFILVGHSMGGLAARALVLREPARPVRALLTIASPHGGTAVARFGRGRNAGEMRPGSEFLRGLDAQEALHPIEIPVLCLYTPHDNVVMPQASGRLPGARNVPILGVGHLSIVDHEATWRELRAFLEGTA